MTRDSRSTGATATVPAVSSHTPARSLRRVLVPVVLGASAALCAVAGYLWWSRPEPASTPVNNPTKLTRVTFEEGLQAEPTWSPDGRFVAYSANAAGNFDIWVQPLGGGRAVQVTTDPAVDWQPAWSPDGNSLTFRSERDGGGIFIVPALGGRERRLAGFGYSPLWSRDGSQILVVRGAPQRGAEEVIPHVFLLNPTDGAPTRILEAELGKFRHIGAIVWHPDGQRISFLGLDDKGPGFWTQPIAGGPAIRADPRPDVRSAVQQFEALGVVRWAPAGDAVYLEATSQRVRSVWRIEVDPATLQWTAGPTRLTTGVGSDTDVSIAPDGNRLAFVTRTEVSRLWAWPFDANTRRVTGEAVSITHANMSVSGFDLSPNGALVYIAARPGKAGHELWFRPADAGEPVLLAEAPPLLAARLSRDGARLSYGVTSANFHVLQRKWRAVRGGDERTLPNGVTSVWDWSPDGERVLSDCPPPAIGATLCELPIAAASATAARQILSDAEYNIWQGRYSPDGRWVLFNAQSRKEPGVSILGVVPVTGGKWIPLTDKTLWADKARWSPDGRTIYFISNRASAFFDVWGVEFDPAKGALVGTEFRVTRHENPSRLVTSSVLSELGVNATQLVVPITETSGSVWVLDNIRR